MDKVIPILPCPEIKTLVAFYQLLGFDVTGLYTSPSPYATIRLGSIELHFWGSRKNSPTENPSMCYIQVDDVDAMYDGFIGRLKERTGKVPRSGIPKISRVRDLVNDRRFTLTDTGGNTIFIGKPVVSGSQNFFRTLDHEEYGKKFALLYDVLHSKEDPALAASTLPKYGIDKNALHDLDKAKFLLLLFEIQHALEHSTDDEELNELLEINQGKNENWNKIKFKYSNIIHEG